MSASFPTRVNRRDADRHFTARGNHKKPESEVKIFSRGARHYLHPSLSILDKIDCELIYYRNQKFMVVSYEPTEEFIDNTDYTRKVYNRAIFSADVKFVTDIIYEYINDSKKYEENNSAVINSNDSEPLDITTEDYNS